MSAAPQSPPETPSKQAMALGNEDLSRPQTPPLNAQLKRGSDQMEAKMEAKVANSSQDQDIQVSATQELNNSDDERHDENTFASELGDEPNNVPSDDDTEAVEDDHQTQHGHHENGQVEESEVEEKASADDDLDFDAIDWNVFRAEYEGAISKAEQDEHALWEEFNMTVNAFGNWAEASGACDNARGVKRLKTREKFVQISENNLRNRKKHYIQVVDAFRKALELLK